MQLSTWKFFVGYIIKMELVITFEEPCDDRSEWHCVHEHNVKNWRYCIRKMNSVVQQNHEYCPEKYIIIKIVSSTHIIRLWHFAYILWWCERESERASEWVSQLVREWEGGATITYLCTYAHDFTLGIWNFSVFSFIHEFDSVTNLIVGFIWFVSLLLNKKKKKGEWKTSKRNIRENKKRNKSQRVMCDASCLALTVIFDTKHQNRVFEFEQMKQLQRQTKRGGHPIICHPRQHRLFHVSITKA